MVSLVSLHSDVIYTHILTRLDGPTLTSFTCVSSQLHSLSEDETLWTNICLSTWPSADQPRISKLISDFGPHRFFSSSFPHLISPENLLPAYPSSLSSNEIISAVDIRYKNKLIFTRVQETETHSRWFRCSPFRIDLLEPKDVVPTPIQVDEFVSDELELSWIIVVDGGKKAAGNLSSMKPVSVEKHAITKDIRVGFSTILLGVECGIIVMFEGEEMMRLCEVSMHVEDVNGISLNGEDSLGILGKAVETGERRKVAGGEMKGRYEEFVKKTRRNKKREWGLEESVASIAAFLKASFWMLLGH